MRHLTVDGTTYDTVGEASVTQVVSSGTKVATVTIDGTATDIYAPGGSSVSPYTSNPAMDGTASAGSSDNYARGDHVHPTDTSRAASSHAHGNITSGGDITATAPTIASGDKLIINDESASKVTNGPSFGSDTTKFLRNDGSWAVPSGGGGSSTWTDITNQIIADRFSGTVLADGHLCVVIGESQVCYFNESFDLISDGLPSAAATTYVTVFNLDGLPVEMAVDDAGNMYATWSEEVDPSVPLRGFTIVYPVAGS